MGQLHEVTIAKRMHCASCNVVLQSVAWKRNRSPAVFCKSCATQIEKDESNKSQRRAKSK